MRVKTFSVTAVKLPLIHKIAKRPFVNELHCKKVKLWEESLTSQTIYLHCFDLKVLESNSLNISFSSLLELRVGLTTIGFP